MIYKPEDVVDLDTGAIVDADVRQGNEHAPRNWPSGLSTPKRG
jgi:hypothetical protein